MRHLVFDVESVGLHGPGFAVGWVLLDGDLVEVDSGFAACPWLALVGGDFEAGRWLAQNYPPDLPVTATSTREVRDKLWGVWDEVRRDGRMYGDVIWPVEARFLIECVDDAPSRTWDGPYPLLDVASLLAGAGLDPLSPGAQNRQHDPLEDARASAQKLRVALNVTARRS